MPDIKNNLVSWFIRNVVSRRLEIFDFPGFLIEKLFYKRDKFVREFLLSETIISNIEKKVSAKNAYFIGKKFGYLYASLVDLPLIKDISEKEFLNFTYFLVRDIESIYASKIEHKIDYSSRLLHMKMHDYISCSDNGRGQIFSMGGIAGIWAYMCSDKAIEAVKPKCQGRGDPECEVIVAPINILKDKGFRPIQCQDVKASVLSEKYEKFNRIRPTIWAKQSLKHLIDSHIFIFNEGKITYGKERFFLCESSFMYVMETELKKSKSYIKTLWDVSFNFGKSFVKIQKKRDPCKFITDIFPAMGFGDVHIIHKKDMYKIYFNYYPWSLCMNNIDFVMLRGIISGIISETEGKLIEFKNIDKKVSQGYLSLCISN